MVSDVQVEETAYHLLILSMILLKICSPISPKRVILCIEIGDGVDFSIPARSSGGDCFIG